MGEKKFTPPKRFRPFAADKGPWLIWSHRWGCWHCRSSEGHAAGYTGDILRAGVFDEATARAYHDTGKPSHRSDTSIPAAKALAYARHARNKLAQELAAADAMVAALSTTLQQEGSEGG